MKGIKTVTKMNDESDDGYDECDYGTWYNADTQQYYCYNEFGHIIHGCACIKVCGLIWLVKPINGDINNYIPMGVMGVDKEYSFPNDKDVNEFRLYNALTEGAKK